MLDNHNLTTHTPASVCPTVLNTSLYAVEKPEKLTQHSMIPIF